MLRNFTENVRAKLSEITSGHSMVKSARRDNVFSERLELEASPVEGESLQPKDKKRRNRKGANKKNRKPREGVHFLV